MVYKSTNKEDIFKFLRNPLANDSVEELIKMLPKEDDKEILSVSDDNLEYPEYQKKVDDYYLKKSVKNLDSSDGDTILTAACIGQKTDIIKYILKLLETEDLEKAFRKNKNGFNYLHVLVRTNNLGLIKLLGIDKESLDDNGHNVLHILLYKNPKFSVEVAKYLGFNTPIVIKTTKNIPMPLTYYFDNWNSLNDSQKELFNSLSPEIIKTFVGNLTFEQLNSLVNKLNPEQIQKITESLTPEQMDTISSYKEGKIFDKLIKNAGTLAQRSFGRRRKRRNRRRSKRKSNRARKT